MSSGDKSGRWVKPLRPTCRDKQLQLHDEATQLRLNQRCDEKEESAVQESKVICNSRTVMPWM